MNDIERAIIGVSIDLVDRIKDLAELRGHNLTGKMIASVMQETVASAMGIRTSFKIIDYGITVDSGIDAAMVNSWSAEKKKQVVNALYFYHKLRRNENPYKRALITMKKWEKEGMSTAYSRKFSKDGKRNRFITDNINDDLIKRYNDAIIDAGAKLFEKAFKSAAA